MPQLDSSTFVPIVDLDFDSPIPDPLSDHNQARALGTAVRPRLVHLTSDSSIASELSASSLSSGSTNGTSIHADSPTVPAAAVVANLRSTHAPMATTLPPLATATGKPANGSGADASLAAPPCSPPLHTFPTFLLSLLTAIESDPASIRAHLDNLAGCRAAPAAFAALPQGKPAETDAIVQSLTRIADRLCAEEEEDSVSSEEPEQVPVQEASKKLEALSVADRVPFPLSGKPGPEFASSNGSRTPVQELSSASSHSPARPRHRSRPTTGDPSARRPFVPGDSVEELRRNYEDQLQALKILHAEELYRSQVSHDNEVRCVDGRVGSSYRGKLTSHPFRSGPSPLSRLPSLAESERI